MSCENGNNLLLITVAPDAIHHHVKTCRANMKNMHFVAPEYGSEYISRQRSPVRSRVVPIDAARCLFQDSVTPAIDIYSFGMCALEMAALEIQGNGDTGTIVTEENIRKTVESLDDVQQKDFIRKCLQVDPLSRPSARELLFHPVLFEVHSLKLLAAHALVNSASKSRNNFPISLYTELLITLRFTLNIIRKSANISRIDDIVHDSHALMSIFCSQHFGNNHRRSVAKAIWTRHCSRRN